MKTVLVLSGGMDSTTLLYDLVKEGDQVVALSFRYGQKHKVELDYAKATCEKLGIKHTIVDISSILGLIDNSCLTSGEEVPEGEYFEESMKRTVVPNRNSIMANIAIAHAINEGFDRIALGVHAGDHFIYPDCRPAFIEALTQLAQVCDWKQVGVHTPYLNLTKGEIVGRGIANGTDYALTYTCYNGGEKACGKCGSCNERLEAFASQNAVDPFPYE